MPYIITTAPKGVGLGSPTIPRRAVATLAEVVSTLNATGADWTLSGANGEGGGTVGPLDDGSVIEVAPIYWSDLLTAIQPSRIGTVSSHVNGVDNRFAIIDAYNAAQ